MGRASGPPGGVGEEEEPKAENSDFPKGSPLARGKNLKVGASLYLHPLSGPVTLQGGGGGGAELPLEVLPISIWSPTSRGTAPSPAMPNEVRRYCFGVVGSEDSLLSRAELATEAVSSILRDSDPRKVDALSVRRLWLFCFKEPLLYVQAPSPILFFIVSVLLTDRLFLGLW